MVHLLERWAALEPSWCRRNGRNFRLGHKHDEATLSPAAAMAWRDEGLIQRAVLGALEARGWIWERGVDGMIRVGVPDGLHAVVLNGTDFTRDLLDSYVQRLELERYLLTD